MAIESIGGVVASAVATRSSAAAAPAASAPASFGEVLGNIVIGAAESLKAGEAAAIAGLTGAAPPLAVVGAVTSAQHTLQAALAIRDKVVSAYQEISRMTI
jgi:flagellar hook-basal body complex protein FliE